MTPYKQLIKHHPEQDEYGDCYRTCIACILSVHPSFVPHVYHRGANESATEEMNEWLGQYDVGQFSAMVPGHADMDEVLSLSIHNPGQYMIISGRSPRGEFNHSVVVCDGVVVCDPHTGKPSHDPHEALSGPCEHEGSLYWVVEVLTTTRRITDE